MTEMWNSVADAWDRNADLVEAQLGAATERMLDAAQVGPGAAVLDLAAGPGGAGRAAAERVGAAGSVVLMDVAAGMVAVAARRSEGMAQVVARMGDLVAIDAPDASFDVVVCRHGLMFCEAPADAVREARRVLRPGGRYAAITWGSRADNPWLGLIFDAVGEQFGVAFPPPAVRGPFALADAGLLGDALEEGGLEDVRVERVATPMRAPSLEEWWGRVPELAGPLAHALAGMEDDVRDEIRSRALDAAAAAARTVDGRVELDGAVLVASGSRPR